MNRTQSLVFAAAVCAALGLVASYKFGPRLYNRYRLHQLMGREVYDPHADAKVAVAIHLARANKEHKRVLVVLGGNWCQWCLALDDLMHEDVALREYLEAHFVVLKLDSRAARPFENIWGNPSQHGVPVLVFLNERGEVKHVQETVTLELWKGRILGHDPQRVLAVLRRWGEA